MPRSSTAESDADVIVSDAVVYLNGEIVPLSQARVSVMDRGFLFGDGVYEVIPVYGGEPLRLDQHLERLRRSMSRVSMSEPLSRDQWKAVFQELLDKNPGGDRSIYLQVTRGAAPYRDLSIDSETRPTVFVMVNAIKPVGYATLEAGIEVVTVDDFRWKACDIKSVSLIANVIIRLQANQASFVDAIMVRNGLVTEATASNVFVVHKDVISTPPISNLLLPGITRDLVIELARTNGLEIVERDIHQSELETADEIWLTSSTREIAPVVKINQQPVGDGVAGDSWKKMIALYTYHKQALRNG